jgi:hypothetical protein
VIKRRAIHAQVADDGERLRAERLDEDGVAVLEFPHVELARRGLARAVRDAVDRERAGAADALAAVVIKGDGLVALAREFVVHDVEHL